MKIEIDTLTIQDARIFGAILSAYCLEPGEDWKAAEGFKELRGSDSRRERLIGFLLGGSVDLLTSREARQACKTFQHKEGLLLAWYWEPGEHLIIIEGDKGAERRGGNRGEWRWLNLQSPIMSLS